MEKKISVIVPIYHVEQYLEKCIESIINQTYRNLEIILIDDGSTDKCPMICDKYAAMDNRIRVIHKENGGISSVRNLGLKEATGEYLAYVDGDDAIDENMFMVLYENMNRYEDCNISCCFFDEVWDLEGIAPISSEVIDKQKIEYLDKIEAIKKTLYQKGTDCCVWGKLYRKDVFDKVHFPEGKIYEDLAVTCYILEQADHVVFSDYQGYHYLQRENSIIRAKFSESKMSLVDFAEENEAFLIKKYPEVYKAAISRTVRANFHLYLQIPGTKEYKHMRQRVEKMIKERRMVVLKDKDAAVGTKAAILLTYLGFSVLRGLKSLKNWGKVN